MLRAVIFDMDGVIVNTETHFIALLKKHLDALAVSYEDELLYSFVGSSDPMVVKKLHPIVSPHMSGSAFLDNVNRDIAEHPLPYKELKATGLYEVLTHFKSRGYKMALASSSPRWAIEEALKALQIFDFFDVVSSGHEYVESKPNPEIYRDTMDKLGVDKTECIVIEDSTYGIEAASAAGIYVIAIRDQHFGMRQDHANMIVDTLEDVIEVVKTLEGKDKNDTYFDY